MKKRFMTIAAASLLSVGAVGQVLAQDSQDPVVKCYGIAKSGSNDCSNSNAKHGCAGQSAVDYDPCEWKAVTRSECQNGIKDKNKHIIGTEKPQHCQNVSADSVGEIEMAAYDGGSDHSTNVATIPPEMSSESTTDAIINDLNGVDASMPQQNSQASSDSSAGTNNNNVVIIKKKKKQTSAASAAPAATNNSVAQTQTSTASTTPAVTNSSSVMPPQNTVANAGVATSSGNNSNTAIGMHKQSSSVTATVPTNNANAAVATPQQNSATTVNGSSVTITGSSEAGISPNSMSSGSSLGVSSSNTIGMPQQNPQASATTGSVGSATR